MCYRRESPGDQVQNMVSLFKRAGVDSRMRDYCLTRGLIILRSTLVKLAFPLLEILCPSALSRTIREFAIFQTSLGIVDC